MAKAKTKKDSGKLRIWQERLSKNETAYSAILGEMDEREKLYRGEPYATGLTSNDKGRKVKHVRNICAEMIESQIDSNIPQPKVTAKRKNDEGLARLIEDMLRNELDRLPFEAINDMMERTVPIQGGAAFLVEWDNTDRTHNTVGELSISALHPKQIIPQDGVYSSVEDMDYIILKMPQTKEYIKRKYGTDLDQESEEEPEIRGADGVGTGDDMITQYIAYYRNDAGGIGLFSWACDTVLEDIDDYQARRLRHCKKCGAPEPSDGSAAPEFKTDNEDYSGVVPADKGLRDGISPSERVQVAVSAPGQSINIPIPEKARGKKRCPVCGCTEFTDESEEYEEIWQPITTADGTVIPGAQPLTTESGILDAFGYPEMQTEMIPTRIPYYKPDIFPVILQKSVSVYGQFLGDSDIDKIKNQQNTTNRIEAKIIDKLIKSGSYITLPDKARIETTSEDAKIIRPGNAADKSLIGVYDLEGNINQDIAYLGQIYEEARQVIGITDSFQGRTDRTATSGKAKEFSAAQAAGRLESKRIMKNAAYAALFEAMFKFRLAYTDEPRPVYSKNISGNSEYKEFNRYDFLEQDEAGAWSWNDRFLFSCDTTAPLASNREAMWQETRLNLQSGAFGDPASDTTLILFWTKMEQLHYPGAAETKSYLEEQYQKKQEQAIMRQAQMQAMQDVQAQMGGMAQGGTRGADDNAVIERARQDAMRDSGYGAGI